jgi:hypothetical protein
VYRWSHFASAAPGSCAVLSAGARVGAGIYLEIVPPGTDVGTLDQAYVPPALQNSSLRRRPVSERTAT